MGTCSFSSAFAAEKTLKILSDRTDSHLKPLFEQYEKKTGTKISAVFMEKGLLNRLETRPTEADLVITKDADLLEIAKQKRLLQPFSSDVIQKNVPQEFRDSDRTYVVDAFRARVIFYAKDRVSPSALSSYEELASPKWKGKLCIRSGYHDYNLALFGQMMAAYGAEKAKKIIAGLHDNLARDPKGNDREQAKAILENKCDVALMNTYYYPIMQTNADQKPWADATRVFFPDQKEKGTFIMRSAAALTTATANTQQAIAFLEYLVSKDAQKLMTDLTFQYPVNTAVPAHEATHTLGTEQTDVKNGAFKMNFVPLADIAKNREGVIKILDELNFDKK